MVWAVAAVRRPPAIEGSGSAPKPKFPGAWWRAAISAVTPPRSFAPASTVCVHAHRRSRVFGAKGLAAAGVRQCRAPVRGDRLRMVTVAIRIDINATPSTATGRDACASVLRWRRQWRRLPRDGSEPDPPSVSDSQRPALRLTGTSGKIQPHTATLSGEPMF